MTEEELQQKKQALIERTMRRFGLTPRDIYFNDVSAEQFESFMRRLEQIEQRVAVIESEDARRVLELEAENAELRRRLSRHEPDTDPSSAH